MLDRHSRRLVKIRALLSISIDRTRDLNTLKTTNHTKVNSVLERCHSDNTAYGHRFPVIQKGRFADIFLNHTFRLLRDCGVWSVETEMEGETDIL